MALGAGAQFSCLLAQGRGLLIRNRIDNAPEVVQVFNLVDGEGQNLPVCKAGNFLSGPWGPTP